MPVREYKIDFHQLNLRPTAEIESLMEVFSCFLEDPGFVSDLSQGGYTREIWGLDFDHIPNAVCGQFRKFRTTDIPEIGAVGGNASPIELDEGQGLIERNFFVYFQEHDIIAWHVNTHSSSVNQFANFLSSISDLRITAAPVIELDAIQRLMRNSVTLKKIEISIPRPTNPELYPDDDYGGGIMDLMNNVDADSMKLSLGVDLRRADSEGRLATRLKTTLRNMVGMGATTIKAHVFEDGSLHPIDLIADRIYSYQSIETNAHFPPNLTMYNLIDTAKAERQGELDGYFGAMDDSLI